MRKTVIFLVFLWVLLLLIDVVCYFLFVPIASLPISHCTTFFWSVLSIGFINAILLLFIELPIAIYFRNRVKRLSTVTIQNETELTDRLIDDFQNQEDERPGKGYNGQQRRICCAEAAPLSCGWMCRRGLFLIIFNIIFTFAALFIIFGLIYVRQATNGLGQPQTLNLEGLRDIVTVEYEDNGMIHIVGSNDHDVMMAQGFVTAQNRIFQMELQRRIAQGRLSEIVGKDALEIDQFFRSWQIYETAKTFDPPKKERELIDAYVDGVNAYIKSKPNLPLEFHLLGYEPEEWNLTDSASWQKLMDLDLSQNWYWEIQRYALMVLQNLTMERLEQLMPAVSVNETTILSAEDMLQSGFWRSNSSTHSTKRASLYQATEWITLEEKQRIKKDVEFAKAKVHSVKSLKEIQQEQQAKGQDPQGYVATLLKTLLASSPMTLGGKASNNWVIGGNRTKSGKPILANDPHLGLRGLKKQRNSSTHFFCC